jgi:uncharacterized protein YukE
MVDIRAVAPSALMAATPSSGRPGVSSSEADGGSLSGLTDSLDTLREMVLPGGEGSFPQKVIAAGLSIASDTVGTVGSVRALMKGVSDFRKTRAEQRLHPQRFLDETSRLRWERDKYVHKAEIASNAYEIAKSGASVVGTLTGLVEPITKQVTDSPFSLGLAAVVLNSSGVAAAATAVAPYLAAAAVVGAVSMGIALVARSHFERQQKKREQQLADSGLPVEAPTDVNNSSTGSDPPQASTTAIPSGTASAMPGQTLPQSLLPSNSINHSTGSTAMINTNPETMRSVSQALTKFAEDIQSAKDALQESVSGAAESWQDDNYTHAESTVAEILAGIEPSEQCTTLASHIDGKATALEEYNAG